MFLTLIVFHTERGYFLPFESSRVGYEYIVCSIAESRKFYDAGGKIIGVVILVFTARIKAHPKYP
jgi:hypothetical protein